ATVTVGQHSKQQRARRPRKQCRADGQDNLALAHIEMRRQRIDHKYDHEKVERIQCPSEYSGSNRVASAFLRQAAAILAALVGSEHGFLRLPDWGGRF